MYIGLMFNDDDKNTKVYSSYWVLKIHKNIEDLCGITWVADSELKTIYRSSKGFLELYQGDSGVYDILLGRQSRAGNGSGAWKIETQLAVF